MPKNVVDFFSSASSSASPLKMNTDAAVDAAWNECYTDNGDVYYYNTVTNESTWERPTNFQPISCDWEEHYTEEGDVYYYNSVTQCSQWECPDVQEVPQQPSQSEPYDDLEWMEYTTEDGDSYYYNVYTEAVQWENPYVSYDYSSYDQPYSSQDSRLEPVQYASETSSERHLEIWSKFFENAFAAQEWMEEERERNRSKAANRAAKAAKLESVVNQWPSRLNGKQFKSLVSSALANSANADSVFGDDEDLNEGLLAAVTQEDYHAAESLLFAGANPNCTDQCIRSPAHYAAKSGNSEMLALLFDQGADLEMCDQVGRTPLHIAALFGREAVAEFLLSCAVDVDGPVDHSGNSPLHLSARGGHAGVVRVLLQFGASSKINNSGGMTALEIAQTMQPQTSGLVEVAAALKKKKRNKKQQQHQGGETAVSPVRTKREVSSQYREMHSDWCSDAESPDGSRSKASHSKAINLKSVGSGGPSSAVDREWRIVRSTSSNSGVSGLSEQLLSAMRERLQRKFDEVTSKLMSRLPPLSPLRTILVNSDVSDSEQGEYKVKLKPFLIEESPPFPSKCASEVEQVLESARANNNQGKSEEALRHLESAAKKAAKQTNNSSRDQLEMYITLCKGNVYQSCGDDEQSLLTYMEGWTRAAAKNDLDWEVIAINAIGILAYYNLRFDVSLLCFHLVGNYRVDTYSEESVDTATAWNNEACCLYCLNKKGEARIRFEKAWNSLSATASQGPEGDKTITAWKNLEKARRSQSAGAAKADSNTTSVNEGSVGAFLRSESEGVTSGGSSSSFLKLPSISLTSFSSKPATQGKKLW